MKGFVKRNGVFWFFLERIIWFKVIVDIFDLLSIDILWLKKYELGINKREIY